VATRLYSITTMYTKLKGSCFAVLFGLTTMTFAFGDVKAIQKDKLPQDPAFQSIYADVEKTEYMVRGWSPKWHYDTPKKTVVSLLHKDLGLLQERVKELPDNEELQLLVGLAAHYSYNLDVQGTFEIAMDAFEKAHRANQDDYRPAWFSANLKCQTMKSVEGMREFLAIERKSPWEQFSAGFWDDYLECATLTNMPSRAIRAGDHLDKLHVSKQSVRDALRDSAKARLKPADPSKDYERHEAWAAVNSGTDTTFTSEIFGLRFTIPGTWRVDIKNISNGLANVQISTGPYHGKEGDLWPTITVIAKSAKPEQSFDDFVKTMSQNLKPTAALVRPIEECRGAEGVKTGLYKAEGDGHLLLTAFMRDQPEFPGLIFEEPTALPETKSNKVNNYVVSDMRRVGRLPGRLYYLIYLDSAASIFVQGNKDYMDFLKNLVVE
jgi:hypothetical protein